MSVEVSIRKLGEDSAVDWVWASVQELVQESVWRREREYHL